MIDARTEPSIPRRATGLAVLAAILLSVGTLHRVTGQAASPLADPKVGAENDSAIVFQGRVVDPGGKPFAGAKLVLGYFKWSERDSPLTLRGVSDQAGRFRFGVDRAYFELPHLEPWRSARVIALADGFGPGGSDSDEPDAGRELTVRLVRDDVPITGRLVDLEGRPVAGATVRVESIAGPTHGDLTPWIKAALAKRDTYYELHSRYLKFGIDLFTNLPVETKVTTDAGGRFVLHGIGRERIAELRIEGPTIRTMRVAALTRVGAPVQAPIVHRRRNPWMKTCYPASFELSAAPSRPIEGIVHDRDTGAPIAGATIRSYRLADLELGNFQLIRTKTDHQGRFRMTGMPLGKGNEVVILPPQDQPYLPSWQRLAEVTVSRPLHAELVLKRGVWAQGKVTDKLTGRPVAASVRYGAAADNPHLSEAPGLRQVPTNGDGTTATETEADGTYRIAVLPGRGILVVRAGGLTYPDPDPTATPDPITFVPPIYGRGQAAAEIDVRPDTRSLTRDFALDPGRRLTGRVVDPVGKPLAGARVYGQLMMGAWSWPCATADFTVYGLAPPQPRTIGRMLMSRSLESLASTVLPEKSRTLLFQHEGKRLAGSIDIAWETTEPVEVRLQPWGEITGRVVDADGRPRAGFAIRPSVLGKVRLGGGEPGHWPDRITTDRDGRFRVAGIVPGLRYRLTFENADGIQSGRGPIVPPLKPAETRDLGDVSGVIPGDPD